MTRDLVHPKEYLTEQFPLVIALSPGLDQLRRHLPDGPSTLTMDLNLIMWSMQLVVLCRFHLSSKPDRHSLALIIAVVNKACIPAKLSTESTLDQEEVFQTKVKLIVVGRRIHSGTFHRPKKPRADSKKHIVKVREQFIDCLKTQRFQKVCRVYYLGQPVPVEEVRNTATWESFLTMTARRRRTTGPTLH